jgi:undecaprenyl-diphosphatase
MRRPGYALYALFLALFGWLAYAAHHSGGLPGDNDFSAWVQGISLPFFGEAMEAVSYLGDTMPSVVTVAAVALVLLLLRRRLESLFLIMLAIVGGLLTQAAKILVDRPRPGGDIAGGGFSFPSGHVTYAMVMGGFLFFLSPRLLRNRVASRVLRALMAAFVLLIGLSRAYLGVHWPSDVLGGYLLGGLVLTAGVHLYSRVKRPRPGPEAEDARAS